MPSSASTPPPRPIRRRRARRPRIEPCTGLVPIAAAREIVDECSRWLGVPLPGRYAVGIAFRAHRCFAHSPSFREKVMRPGTRGRAMLWLFLRHWLAARLHAEAFPLYARLPRGYAVGEPLPALPAPAPTLVSPGPLSPDARLLATWT